MNTSINRTHTAFRVLAKGTDAQVTARGFYYHESLALDAVMQVREAGIDAYVSVLRILPSGTCIEYALVA